MENFVDITTLNALFKDVIITGIIVTIAANCSSINFSVYNNSSFNKRDYISNSGSSSCGNSNSSSRSSSCSSNSTCLTLCGKEHLDLFLCPQVIKVASI